MVVVAGVFPLRHIAPQAVYEGDGEGAGGEEGVAADGELAGELVCPAQEHVGDNGGGRRGVVAEPVEYGVVEPGQGAHHGAESTGGEVDGALDAGWDGVVRRKREDEGGDGGGVGGEEGVEEREVLWSDEDGDGEATCGEVVGEI